MASLRERVAAFKHRLVRKGESPLASGTPRHASQGSEDATTETSSAHSRTPSKRINFLLRFGKSTRSMIPDPSGQEEPLRDLYGFQVSHEHQEAYKTQRLISQQEEGLRYQKWADFLEGLRARRQLFGTGSAGSGGDGFAAEELQAVLAEGGDVESDDRRELEALIRLGVPMALRGQVWQVLLRSHESKATGDYRDYLERSTRLAAQAEAGQGRAGTPAGPGADLGRRILEWQRQVDKDLERTFPTHPAMDAHGQAALRRVLNAYMVRNPSVGYCQGMNFIAGCMLMHMGEEPAFWSLCRVVENLLPGYYTEAMTGLHLDLRCFRKIFEDVHRSLSAHLDSLGVDVSTVAISWLLCLFMNSLPLETCLDVWDLVFFTGNVVPLFQVALALLDLAVPQLMKCGDPMDAFDLLKSLAPSAFDALTLVQVAVGTNVLTKDDLEALRDACARDSQGGEESGAASHGEEDNARPPGATQQELPRRPSSAGSDHTVVECPGGEGPSDMADVLASQLSSDVLCVPAEESLAGSSPPFREPRMATTPGQGSGSLPDSRSPGTDVGEAGALPARVVALQRGYPARASATSQASSQLGAWHHVLDKEDSFGMGRVGFKDPYSMGDRSSNSSAEDLSVASAFLRNESGAEILPAARLGSFSPHDFGERPGSNDAGREASEGAWRASGRRSVRGEKSGVLAGVAEDDREGGSARGRGGEVGVSLGDWAAVRGQREREGEGPEGQGGSSAAAKGQVGLAGGTAGATTVGRQDGQQGQEAAPVRPRPLHVGDDGDPGSSGAGTPPQQPPRTGRRFGSGTPGTARNGRGSRVDFPGLDPRPDSAADARMLQEELDGIRAELQRRGKGICVGHARGATLAGVINLAELAEERMEEIRRLREQLGSAQASPERDKEDAAVTSPGRLGPGPLEDVPSLQARVAELAQRNAELERELSASREVEAGKDEVIRMLHAKISSLLNDRQ